MSAEPLSYRARKWALQNFTTAVSGSDQHERLDTLEWDVCVVLDACRYDALAEVADWPIERCRSPGSATEEWLTACADSGVYEGAYIAAGNVNYANTDLGAAEVDHVWSNHWNDRLGTVLPEPVLDSASMFLDSGDCPVVAHLLPPHAPYVARIGGTWLPAFPDVDIWRRNPGREEDGKLSPQVAMATGHVDMRRAIEGYRASVASTWSVVTDYIGQWVANDRTVVVTADHGETFGRLQDGTMYGHPNRVHIGPLVDVPWIVFKQPSPIDVKKRATSVTEKLEALGYVE